MQFDPPLEEGRLLRRYKRFLADIETLQGEALTIHCPNTGSMHNCMAEGGRVWFSRSSDPKRKLPGTWELSETPQGRLACVNTARANALVEEALRAGVIAELASFAGLRREVRYGEENSRVDFCLDFAGEAAFIDPGYWQGKVRATVTTASGVKVRSAPTGDKGGPQVAPNQVLCLGSVVEFQSDKVRWLQLEDGKNYPMAECSFVPGQGGLKGEGTLPATFWICVEDTGKGKMVNRDAITPDRFDSVVTLKTAIRAGDPIGYMGLYETPTASGGRNGKHQIHIEVFTGDAQLQAFLDNQAKLEDGRKYLRLPANTELADRSVLEAKQSLLPAKGQKLQHEHVVALDKSPITKDSKGQEWYQVTVLENRQSITGLVKKPTSSSSDLEVICQYDFKKLGFRIVEEQNSNSDGFLDKDNIPAFFKGLYNEIDRIGDGNGEVSPQELATALRDPGLRERWSKLIALHPTEWQAKSSAPKWQRLRELLKDSPELLKHEQERIDNLAFWDEIASAMQITQTKKFHHLHPIRFIEHLTHTPPPADNIIRKIGDIISHGEGNYESYNTGTKDVPGKKVGFSFINPPAGTITSKTINSIIATEDLPGTNINRMFATGKYQTIISTLKIAKLKMNLSGEELYDEEMQERVFSEYLIKKAGGGALARFVKYGEGSIDDAQYAASKEWASIAAPAGKKIKDHRISDGSLSYHESRANTANKKSTTLLRELLSKIGEIAHDQN